jgi:hypothetical protein
VLPSTIVKVDDIVQSMNSSSQMMTGRGVKPDDPDADDGVSASTKTMTSAQMRKERKQKYSEQRKKDKQLRQEMSKQRHLIYELIQTDKISKIFAAKANVKTELATPTWGENLEHNEDLENDTNAFAGVATVMATHALEGTSNSEASNSKTGTPTDRSRRPSTGRDDGSSDSPSRLGTARDSRPGIVRTNC